MSDYQADPNVQYFFKRLERLEPGERARLKRSAGQSLAEARSETLGLFYGLLPPGLPIYEEGAYFLVATLYPLADGGGKGNLGEVLRRARDDRYAKGLDRRLERLLDADETQLPFHLRQTVRFLQSQRVKVDWPYLLQDLLFWRSPSHPVQRRWARAYFAG